MVEATSGQPEIARTLLEDAVDRYERCLLPFETAVARMELGQLLRRAGRRKAADSEARRAAETFKRLGAARAPQTTIAGEAGLTGRELEVLRLVADGLGDQAIARRLVLSRHTIHRHISNVLLKVGAASRAAAVAEAARKGLL